jgi:anti-sigma regulatory factor (Ser/Thr protein kinase)
VRRSRVFPESSPSVPRARQFVSDSLHAVPQEICETVALLVSELATNAVVHATSDFEVTVIYQTASGRVRVEVTDGDRTLPTPLHPPPNVPHGRGLQLVATLSDEWGVAEATSRIGKTVWFEMAVPPASASEKARADRAPWVRRLPPGASSMAGLRRWRLAHLIV